MSLVWLENLHGSHLGTGLSIFIIFSSSCMSSPYFCLLILHFLGRELLISCGGCKMPLSPCNSGLCFTILRCLVKCIKPSQTSLVVGVFVPLDLPLVLFYLTNTACYPTIFWLISTCLIYLYPFLSFYLLMLFYYSCLSYRQYII